MFQMGVPNPRVQLITKFIYEIIKAIITFMIVNLFVFLSLLYHTSFDTRLYSLIAN